MSDVLDELTRSAAGRRVTPPVPAYRQPRAGDAEDDEPTGEERDDASGWATYIAYTNAKGEQSERRITCIRLEGFAKPELVFAYCHESQRTKSFRIDRMTELSDYFTGELADPAEHFERLHLHGALPMKDKALGELAKVLVFLARCDGEYHPLEADAIEFAFTRYVLRFGGADSDIEDLLKRCDALAPDGLDFARSLGRLLLSPAGPQISRLILESCSSVIDADGHHAPDEVDWAMEVSNQLKALAVQ